MPRDVVRVLPSRVARVLKFGRFRSFTKPVWCSRTIVVRFTRGDGEQFRLHGKEPELAVAALPNLLDPLLLFASGLS